MFDYCFPLDFKTQLRLKLKHCYQNSHPVNEYIHELDELHMMIGITNKREKVLNLWNGLNKNIQEALWLQELNPEVSRWSTVVRVAQQIEISKNLQGSRQDN